MNVHDQLPALVLMVPMLSGIVCPALGWWKRSLCQPLAVLALAASTVFAFMLFLRVAEEGPLHYLVGGWGAAALPDGGTMPIGIVLAVDQLNSLFAAVVAAIALLAAIYARVPMAAEFGEKEPHFYCMLLLFAVGMLGIVLTGDAFNLYVLIEIASITCYALIAMGKGPAPLAALHYVMLGSVGACFYLIGVGYLYAATGSLNMSDLSVRIAALRAEAGGTPPLVLTGFVFCAVGLAMKMALFPLHGWLPNAYAKAADPVTALLAPLFTKVSVYALIRLVLSVFSVDILGAAGTGVVLVSVATAAILYGSVMALRQVELKRMLAYVLIAEIGYFAGGIGLRNADGLLGAMFHLPGDALMMLCLFMVAGTVAYQRRDYLAAGLGGLFKRQPLTAAALVVGALAVVGVPPTPGFFTKLYLVSAAFTAGRWDFAVALLVAAVLNALLFLRLIEIARSDTTEAPSAPAPLSMRLPTTLAAVGVLALGLGAAPLLDFLAPMVPAAYR